MKAQQLVESLLEGDDDAQADPRERAYARLLKLYTRRGELQSEQKWHADYSVLLHRLHVTEDNIKSLDVRDGKLHGIFLKQGDYGAKLQRKAKAKAEQADNIDPSYGRSTGITRRPPPAAPKEVSAYYVPVNPPLWVPEVIRDQL